MPQDLVKFGLIPEFIGRAPVTVSLKSLDISALEKILTEPKNALVKQYRKLFELDGVKLTFTDEAIKELATQSYERKTGARGLRAIMENAVMDIMYETPSDETIEECIVTKEAVLGTKQPELVYKNDLNTKIKKAVKKAKQDKEQSA